ncbi:hypothetical protein VF21_04175 [Pseudogymnoascus sp. 05NY08]|nr:hypothetical protein VF21_04175 [Pseudogymnoascus sp. 05NY08]
MEPPVTPPRKTQSSLRQAHRHHEDARSYASPPKTPMFRSEPLTPTANTSGKRGRDTWAPATPTSLPRRKRHETTAGLSAKQPVGDGEGLFEDNGPVRTEAEIFHDITADKPLATGDFTANEKQYIGVALHWDADIIGVICPFCMETEVHLMPRPSNTADIDLRIPDCDPGKTFRLLFAGDDHPAVKGRKGIWAAERRRWEAVYIEDLCSEKSEAGSEVEEREESTTEEPNCPGDLHHGDPKEILEDREEDQISTSSEGELPIAAEDDLDLRVSFSGDEITTEEPLCSGDQDYGDHEEVLEDMEEYQSITPSEGELLLAADDDVDLLIAFSDDEITTEELLCSGDQDHGDPEEVWEDMEEGQRITPSEGELPLTAECGSDVLIAASDDGVEEAITPQENPEILRIVSSLFNNPPPEYLTLGHGQTAVVYRPVAVIPVLGAPQKTVGFLAPTTSSTKRVFTRSGWRGEEISDADIAWMQDVLATSKEAPWQELSIIKNSDYTDKVRKLSTQLGLEPRSHNYDKENPLGQVCFSHVEKQLVVVALEEHQSSRHMSPTEPLINRTIYLDREPCVGCLDFAKAVERIAPLRFEFNVMTRVMSDTQARKKFRKLDSGSGERGREADDDGEETSSYDHGRRGLQRPTGTRRASTGRHDNEAEYEVASIIDRRTLRGRVEYLVRWKESWLTGSQLEIQLNGLYGGGLDVVREVVGRRGNKRCLVKWENSWVSVNDLGNSRKLIEEFEGGRALLE